MLEMHIRYNANIDNKTYVGERDLQKVIGCLLTYGNQIIRHNWKPFASKFWNSNSTEFYTILKLSALMIPMVPLNNKKGSMTRAVPWNSMELRVHQFRWHEQFHGIPWNLECANFADRSSSMEFHGTCNKPISMTRTVPWNSMELGVNQFRWHKQFHRIPWNFGCANFDDSSSSMEFHGIPWNLECANFADTSSSMEFHGTWSAPISLTRKVPWNSLELECANFAETRSSMEFHGT